MDHLREKERAEREKFNKLPLKPDEPPITPFNIHSSQLSHDKVHGFLEGMDFNQVMQTIENASAKYHPVDMDYLKVIYGSIKIKSPSSSSSCLIHAHACVCIIESYK